MLGGFTPARADKINPGARAACRVGINDDGGNPRAACRVGINGDGGGNIVVTGTPRRWHSKAASYTGQYLKRML